jgi:hypothetical protein
MLRQARALLSFSSRRLTAHARSPLAPRSLLSAAAPFLPRSFRALPTLSSSSASISLALAAAAAAAAATILSSRLQLEARAEAAATPPAHPPAHPPVPPPVSPPPLPADAADALLRCKTIEEVEHALGQLHAAMFAAAGHELGGLQAKTLVQALKHTISVVQAARSGGDQAAAAAVRFMQQLCSTSSAARRCVIDAGGCGFLASALHRAAAAPHRPSSPALPDSASAASDALALLAATDAKRVFSDSFQHLAAALAEAVSAARSPADARALALVAPILVAAAPAVQSSKQFHSLLLPFTNAAHELCSATPCSVSLSSVAHAFAILLASSPLPPPTAPSALPPPLALYLNLMEGAGPSEFRIAAAGHCKLLLQPQAASHKHARAIINSLFHTALAPYTSQAPPLQCAAIVSLSAAAAVPSVQQLVSQSFSIGDIISLVPDLPPNVAASAARLAAASVTDSTTCAKIVDARADELVTGACAAHPKSKELREAAGALHDAAAARPHSQPVFAGELMLRLSMHAKGRCSITLTHRALPLILALSDYSRDPQQQASKTSHHARRCLRQLTCCCRSAPSPPSATSRSRSSTATNSRAAACWKS